MNETKTPDSVFGEIISSYSRSQAIKDGVLVDLATVAPDVCRQHYKFSVACTAAVWGIIEKAVKNPRWMNDINGVVHDMLWMSRSRICPVSPEGGLFQVVIKGAGRKSIFTFRIACGPGDQGEPVITIMLPEED
jgi:hypothetical protein